MFIFYIRLFLSIFALKFLHQVRPLFALSSFVFFFPYCISFIIVLFFNLFKFYHFCAKTVRIFLFQFLFSYATLRRCRQLYAETVRAIISTWKARTRGPRPQVLSSGEIPSDAHRTEPNAQGPDQLRSGALAIPPERSDTAASTTQPHVSR